MILGENGKAVTLGMPRKLWMVVNSHDSALCKIRQVKANGCLRTPGCPRGIPNSELVFLEMPVYFPEQFTLGFGQVRTADFFIWALGDDIGIMSAIAMRVLFSQ
jgi:hypothetical protein